MTSKFELFVKKYCDLLMQNGVDVVNNPPCQYELILEAGLSEVVGQVIFRANGAWPDGVFITEIRLQPQDIFVCNEWGLFLLDTNGGSDVGFWEHTFPDPKYFDVERVREMGIFYNANLSLWVSNRVVLPGVRTDKFRRYMGDEQRRNSGMSGLVEVGEDNSALLMPGSKNIYFRLDLPRETDFKGSTIRLRLRLRGLLFMNAGIIT
jgi:hypothetical protein